MSPEGFEGHQDPSLQDLLTPLYFDLGFLRSYVFKAMFYMTYSSSFHQCWSSLWSISWSLILLLPPHLVLPTTLHLDQDQYFYFGSLCQVSKSFFFCYFPVCSIRVIGGDEEKGILSLFLSSFRSFLR